MNTTDMSLVPPPVMETKMKLPPPGRFQMRFGSVPLSGGVYVHVRCVITDHLGESYLIQWNVPAEDNSMAMNNIKEFRDALTEWIDKQ